MKHNFLGSMAAAGNVMVQSDAAGLQILAFPVV
jgi:hypothetical protein